MDWLNIHTATLDSEDFLGCEPLDQATWLKLMRYCIGQENGGRIENCQEWGDRRWQQIVRITHKESRRECPLWLWDGDTLVVSFYPSEKQAEVQAKRDAARSNGRRGGRPKITQEKPTSVILDNPGETNVGYLNKPTSVESPKAEGNGREGKGMEGEDKSAAAPPPARDESELFGQMPPPSQPALAKNFHDWRCHVGKRIFWTREEDPTWKAIFEAEGWDEMSKGYEYLAKKHPAPGKIFISMFQELRQ